MVEAIKQKIGQTEAFPHFLSILQHFLLFPSKLSHLFNETLELSRRRL